MRKSKCYVRDIHGQLPCFELYYPTEKWNLLIIPEQGTSINELRAAVEFCIKLPPPKIPSMTSKIKKGMLTVLRSPWTATNLVIGTLEKISEGAKAADDYINGEKPITDENSAKTVESDEPTNLASGLLRGAGAILNSIFSAIAGFFLKPIQGARKEGFTGAIKGFGKGLIGLVLKPVAGTIDLVTLTARGLANTPKTIYLNLSNLFKKKPREVRKYTPITPFIEKEVTICERSAIPVLSDDEDNLDFSVDEQELQRQLLEGFGNLYDGDQADRQNEEIIKENINKTLGDEIKKRNKRQKEIKKFRLAQIKHSLKHFKENLDEIKISDEEIDQIMKQKEKKGNSVVNGTLELEYDGVPSPEQQNESIDDDFYGTDNICEFNEDEKKHFIETAEEFDVKCKVVTIGITDGDDDSIEIIDNNTTKNSILSRSCINSTIMPMRQNAKSEIILGSAGLNSDDRFRKNPMHRSPPRILLKITRIEMHSHHVKNPLIRQFTEEENQKLDQIKKCELKQDLIHERFSTYQVISNSKSMIVPKNLLSPQYFFTC